MRERPARVAATAYDRIAFRPIAEPDASASIATVWLDYTDNPAKVKFLAELRMFAKRHLEKMMSTIRKSSDE